jgi:DNA polymerase/3'-5' exonuclease PolX
MKLEEGQKIAEEYIKKNGHQYSRIEVVGSIRRGKPEVKDIDMVAIPKFPQEKLILRSEFQGAKVEVYIANEKNYEVIKLIRTGSANHNVKLATKAKQLGGKLSFAEGVILKDGSAITTEKGILETLLGKYVEPKDREETFLRRAAT